MSYGNRGLRARRRRRAGLRASGGRRRTGAASTLRAGRPCWRRPGAAARHGIRRRHSPTRLAAPYARLALRRHAVGRHAGWKLAHSTPPSQWWRYPNRVGKDRRDSTLWYPIHDRRRNGDDGARRSIRAARVRTADGQDRDGAPDLPAAAQVTWPELRHVFADGAYAGPKLETALRSRGPRTIEIVERSDAASGFEPLPKRWIVERTLARLNRNRSLAKDFETATESARVWLFLASVRLLVRRLAKTKTQ